MVNCLTPGLHVVVAITVFIHSDVLAGTAETTSQPRLIVCIVDEFLLHYSNINISLNKILAFTFILLALDDKSNILESILKKILMRYTISGCCR